MAPDPLRRQAMVDFTHPEGQSLFWRISDALDRLVEQLENHSPIDLLFQKVDRDIAEAERTEQEEDEPPTSPSGGSGMSVNIESARAGVMRAHQEGQTGLAELAAAHSSLEDAANGLRNSTWGSNQPEADQAHGQLAEALQKIDEVRSQVTSALAEFEGVAQRL